MKYKLIFLMFLSVILLSACTVDNSENKTTVTPMDNTPSLYVQEGCSHCEIVEEYLTQNEASGIRSSFQTRDIGKDKKALDAAVASAKICGIPDSELGTPLFYDGNSCYMGSEDVINYFSSKIK